MLSRKDQKFIKSLKVKKYRTREKCFLVEGAKNVQELLKSNYSVDLVVGTNDFFSSKIDLANHRYEIISSDILQQLGTFKTNQDGLAIARMKDFSLDSITFDDHLFVLDGVGDPGNVGTIIRTLDWFGFKQLVCSHDCAEFYHPKVINSTMGSFTRLSVVSCDLNEFYKRNTLSVFAADMEGTSIGEFSLDQPSVIVMGSESHGVGEVTKAHLNGRITIPQIGQAESLNVGIATGIIANHLRMLK